MGLKEQIRKQRSRLERQQGVSERYTVMLLSRVLTDMGIDPTSDIGLLVIDNYRPASSDPGSFVPERITEWLAEMT